MSLLSLVQTPKAITKALRVLGLRATRKNCVKRPQCWETSNFEASCFPPFNVSSAQERGKTGLILLCPRETVGMFLLGTCATTFDPPRVRSFFPRPFVFSQLSSEATPKSDHVRRSAVRSLRQRKYLKTTADSRNTRFQHLSPSLHHARRKDVPWENIA